MEGSLKMGKRFVLFIGLFVYGFFLFELNVFALSFHELTHDVDSQPVSVAVDDFNGDGKLDLAVSNRGSNTVSILLGNGDGTFQTAINSSVNNPQSVVAGDFNKDGKLDLAVAKGGSNSVSILFGKGDGTFQTAINSSVNNPQSVVTGDFNKDGKLDLAVAKGGSNGVSILIGNGNGTFQTAINYSTGTNTTSVTIGDFNKDGKLDLAVSNSGSNSVSILRGNGDGTFQSAMNFGVNSPQSVAVGDFNKDGKLDLAVAKGGSNGVSILLGKGDGTFQSAINYSAGTNTPSVAVGDFDDDGKLDLAVSNSGSNSVSILLGKGDGTFQNAEDFKVENNPVSVVVGDFNGDSKLDLAVSNSGSNSVSILLNTTSLVNVPGAPTGVTATAGDSQATVSFSAPVSNGGSPITLYTVMSTPGKITATGATSPIDVLGLTNGTAYTFSVTATNAIGTGPASAPSNSVTPGPIISVSPMSVNFGSGRVGSTSTPKTVMIKSEGNVNLIINSISVTGANQSEFIQINNCSTIPAKGSCPITLTFAPVIPFGKKSAILSISSDDPKKPMVTVKLSGEGSSPNISVSPSSVNGGKLKVGEPSVLKAITVKNTGVSDLVISSIEIGETNAAEFSHTSNCLTAAIPKGSSCAINLTITPALPFERKHATMNIASNDPKKSMVTLKLSGESSPPKISVSPSSINLKNLSVGSSSAPKMVTIKNTGISDLEIGSITINGTNADEFSITNDCSTIPKGSSCAVTLTFSPKTAGGKKATLDISTNDPKKPVYQVKLSGKGI
jgi:hypothetical protein